MRRNREAIIRNDFFNFPPFFKKFFFPFYPDLLFFPSFIHLLVKDFNKIGSKKRANSPSAAHHKASLFRKYLKIKEKNNLSPSDQVEKRRPGPYK